MGRRWTRSHIAVVTVSIWIGFCVWRSMVRLPVWKDNAALWSTAIRESPAKTRPWVNYAESLLMPGINAETCRASSNASRHALWLGFLRQNLLVEREMRDIAANQLRRDAQVCP